jgi:hypothetical protein
MVLTLLRVTGKPDLRDLLPCRGNKLPIGEEPTVLFVGTEPVTIKRYQIAVWVSINDVMRSFPAVLDTGHSHNLSITESRLKTFAGVSPAKLDFIGTTRLKGERLRQYRADVWIHRDRSGTMELGEGSFRLTIDEGISLAQEGSCRLPLNVIRNKAFGIRNPDFSPKTAMQTTGKPYSG